MPLLEIRAWFSRSWLDGVMDSPGVEGAVWPVLVVVAAATVTRRGTSADHSERLVH